MQKFNQNDVKIIEKTPVREGFLSLYKLRLQHRLFEGDWSPVFEREVMDRGHAVVVLPYDPHKDALVVLEQFRVGALENDASPWLLEFVAGMYDSHDETAEQVAHRELEEEAGLTAKSLHYALTYLSTPGGCTEKISIYIALVDSDKAARHAGLATEHEDIRVHVVPADEALARATATGCINANAMISLQWLALNKDQLRARWLATAP